MELDGTAVDGVELRPAEFWRSLEELDHSPDFEEALQREFPRFADRWPEGLDRRRFLELMAASLALAGLGGCESRPAPGKLVPYLETPEELVQGRPLAFATAMPLGGYALGLLVESHMGRPTKVEGNPDHPASLGATDVFAQASVLSLYDPDRAETLQRFGQIATREAFLDEVSTQRLIQRGRNGAGLRLLTETVTSPTLAAQIDALREAFPEAGWHQYEPIHRDHARAGATAAFGRDVQTVYHLDRADTILALDDDFLATGPAHVRYARDFASRRRALGTAEAAQPPRSMSRLYVVEPTVTLTGAAADHRLPVRPPGVEAVARLIARRLGLEVDPPADADRDGVSDEWIDAVVSDLTGELRGGDSSTSLVTAGFTQPAVVHALAHAINAALGSVGTTVEYIEPVEAARALQTQSLEELAESLREGEVETLIIIGGNPVFTAPAGMDLGRLLQPVPFTLHLSESVDETSAACRWHVPQAHFLESWSDARAFDG
ncbi:MAG TPA: TAT-variant-translocated molybdopterin oxidoreductase, partial [Planctomycetaceae bacterium]|nr:TAT-variant-translocated molybdopterin oxidoreductase [Planctomycetaceae bacterium]